ncbi:hypothetical protein EMPS_03050 [Entomortierella parvispora]|uniref:BTB domain-containing protein n=1 Tax=Entomortierella parvispora TaxID=205924 RepID=A0A9P3H633_9FUNG|nr:hypothetical protein EMPS_03050 [Entomortierella parvispora]
MATTMESTSTSAFPSHTYPKGYSSHGRPALSLPLTMAFNLELTNKTKDLRRGIHAANSALDDALPIEDFTTITIELQHGFQVCIRGLSQITVFLDELDVIATTSETTTVPMFAKAPRRFLVILSASPIRFFFPVSVLDPERLRLYKKPFGQSLLSQFLVRAARESAASASGLYATPATRIESASVDEATAAIDGLTFKCHGGTRTSDVEFVVNSTSTDAVYRSSGPSTAVLATTGNSHVTHTIIPTSSPGLQDPQQQNRMYRRPFGDFDLIIAAHRSILQQWPEFASLLQNHPRPWDLPVQLKCPSGLDLLALQSVIQFLYLGQIQGPGHHFYYSHRQEAASSLSTLSQGDGKGVFTRVEGSGDVDWRKIFQVAYRFKVLPLFNIATESLLQEHEGYLATSEDVPICRNSHTSRDQGPTDQYLQYSYGVTKRCPVQTLFQWAYQYPNLEKRLLGLIFRHYLVDLVSEEPMSFRAGARVMNAGPQQGRDVASVNEKVKTERKRKRVEAGWWQHQQFLRQEKKARLVALHEKLNCFRNHPEFSRIHTIILARILRLKQTSGLHDATFDAVTKVDNSVSASQATKATGLPTRKQVPVMSLDNDDNSTGTPRKRRLPPNHSAIIPDRLAQ